MDRQSAEKREAVTTPCTGNTEPPDRGNQSDEQSNSPLSAFGEVFTSAFGRRLP
jgi:hypothetical protein